MENLDKETLLKIIAGFAVFFAALFGFFAQLLLKQLDNNLIRRREKENQKLKFYIPLLRCLYELDDRFIRIFKNLDKDWLSAKYLEEIKLKKGFAENPKEKGYFIISSIYLIGCFFGVTEAIKKGVDTTRLSIDRKNTSGIWNWLSNKFRTKFTTRAHYDIFQFDPDITIICRLLQNKELFYKYIASKDFKNPKDANEIHKHIQHSIGEMMLEKQGEDKYRVKSFREFYELYVNDVSFRFWFILIEGYFTDLCNFDASKKFEKRAELKNDIRPLRLLAIQYWCRKLMSNISTELELDTMNFVTRKPDEVLKSVEIEDDLKQLITSYKLENSDTYLLGLKINID